MHSCCHGNIHYSYHLILSELFAPLIVFRVFHDAHFCAFWRTFGPNDPNNYHYCVMVDAKLCAQHLLLKRMIQIDVGAICYLRVSTTRTWVRIADIGDETVDYVSVQFFASKRQTLCIHYWYAMKTSLRKCRSQNWCRFSRLQPKNEKEIAMTLTNRNLDRARLRKHQVTFIMILPVYPVRDQYVTLSNWKWPPKSTTWGSQWPLKIFLKGKPCVLHVRSNLSLL